MFYFDFANYRTMLRLAWNEPSPKARVYYLVVLLLGVPITASFHAVCFALDPILFPRLADVEMKEPIFMVGHARSGTTLTHRLMSADEGRFSSFLLWECYFPSLLQKSAIRWAAEVDDRFLGGALGSVAQRFEEWRYGSFRHMHEMGLTVPEEDDISLFYSMASGFWITKMPYMGDLDFYHMAKWPERKRQRVNEFYRDVVRRQLYLNGTDKTHLAKNPLWSGRVASLIEAFPDAKFVVNVRDPRETIPSLLKLMMAGWKQLGWERDRQQRCLDVLVGQSWDTYLHPIDTLDAHPNVKGAIVDYRDLTSDPAATIEKIYQDLDLPITDELRAFLAQQAKREKWHATKHAYSLEEFGLEDDAIRENLQVLFDRFEWDAGGNTPDLEIPTQGDD